MNVGEDIYEGAIIIIRSLRRETKDFKVRLGVHQGLVLSSYLFSLVMDEITKNIQWGTMLKIDIVLIGDSPQELNDRLEEWKKVAKKKLVR